MKITLLPRADDGLMHSRFGLSSEEARAVKEDVMRLCNKYDMLGDVIQELLDRDENVLKTLYTMLEVGRYAGIMSQYVEVKE